MLGKKNSSVSEEEKNGAITIGFTRRWLLRVFQESIIQSFLKNQTTNKNQMQNHQRDQTYWRRVWECQGALEMSLPSLEKMSLCKGGEVPRKTWAGGGVWGPTSGNKARGDGGNWKSLYVNLSFSSICEVASSLTHFSLQEIKIEGKEIRKLSPALVKTDK